jgi:hypothetical protein
MAPALILRDARRPTSQPGRAAMAQAPIGTPASRSSPSQPVRRSIPLNLFESRHRPINNLGDPEARSRRVIRHGGAVLAPHRFSTALARARSRRPTRRGAECASRLGPRWDRLHHRERGAPAPAAKTRSEGPLDAAPCTAVEMEVIQGLRSGKSSSRSQETKRSFESARNPSLVRPR